MNNKKIIKQISSFFLVIVLLITIIPFGTFTAKAKTPNVHTITDANEIIGTSASVWGNFNDGDIIDISFLLTTELGRIYIPETISNITIKGSVDKTYTKFCVSGTKTLSLTLENVKVASSTGPAAFYFPENSQLSLIAVGINEIKAADNSKCIIGNVVFKGAGDICIQSGKTTNESNLAHGIYGNVIFDHTGSVTVISGNGKSGTSSSVNGLSAGDAICGNVECRNTGNIYIEAGDGGSVYTNSSASGGKGGNGGSGINGNLLCDGNNSITIKGGTGNYLGLRNTYSTPGTSGSGVFGNVIAKHSTKLTISGEYKRTTTDTDGYGICGYLKAYDNSEITVSGANGALKGSSMGGNGGIGIYGNVSLYNNAKVICNGGNGGNGDSGNSSYPSSFGSGGNGNIGIIGDVYLFDTTSLTCSGGNGGNGGNCYLSSPTSGTSDGGSGATAITGNIFIDEKGILTVCGGNGGNGGRAKTARGGDAGSGILGNLTVGSSIILSAKAGTIGTKYYSASGTNGKTAFDIITSTIPTLNGGYIDALFYNASKGIVVPVNTNGNKLYLTKITPYIENELIPNSSVLLTFGDLEYPSTINEKGEIYCYLPSNEEIIISCDNYGSILSQVWEDNKTEMVIFLEKLPCSHSYDNACDGSCNDCGDIRSITHNYSVAKYDSTGHWNECECGTKDEVKPHAYDNVCDTTCTCGYTRSVTHNYSDATCTTPKTCKICGDTTGNKLSHKSDSGTVTKAATCTATGTKTYKCTLCNATIKTDTIAKVAHKYDSGKVTKAATCKDAGEKTYTCSVCKGTKTSTIARLTTHTYSNNCDKSCNVCGKTRTVGAHKYSNNCDTSCNVCKAKRTIKHTYSNNCDTSCNVCKATRSITHTYKTTTTKATLTKNGSIVKKCTVCGKVASKSTIKYVKTFKLSTTTYTYDGKAKTPSITVKDSAGKTLKKNTDYTVTYASGRKNVGTYKVTVKMIGKYSGTKTLTFKINPTKTTVSKLTAGKKSITVAIAKKSTQVTGYQIQYSTSKTFSKATTKTISSYKTTKYTLKSLSAKKTYYVRVRTYKTVGKTKYYSGWSTYKYVKTK